MFGWTQISKRLYKDKNIFVDGMVQPYKNNLIFWFQYFGWLKQTGGSNEEIK